MKKSHFLLILLVFSIQVNAQFITTWQTTNLPNEQVTIPTFPSETYNYTVDWGDGTIDAGITGDATHLYSTTVLHTVTITGVFPRIYFNNGNGHEGKLLTVEQWGNNSWTSMENAFFGCYNLKINATDIPNLAGVTDLSAMFPGKVVNGFLHSNIGLGTGNWNWDTSTITNMRNMFAGATSFNKDISSWNTTLVTDMYGMFSISAFNQDISSWNTANVTTMEAMFQHSPFNQNIGVWNTAAVTNMRYMFWTSAFNQDIGTWNVSSVTTMESMFARNHFFNQDIGSWIPSSVTSFQSMFSEADAFNQDISSWDTSAATNMYAMFDRALAFDQNIGSWNIENVTDFLLMFDQVQLSNANYDALLIGWDAQNVQPNKSLNAGLSIYCSETAQIARQHMKDTYGWTFIDGGLCNQAPEITSNGGGDTATINIVGGKIAVTTVTATDLENDTVIFEITGGADANKFLIDTNTGELTFVITTDFDNPADSNLDNQYIVEVTANDNTAPNTTDSQTITVKITDASYFIAKWRTTNPNETITIPTFIGETYNYDVDWDNDGVFEDAANTGNTSHTFSVPGDYTVKIKGAFPRMYFNYGTGNVKIRSIDQWGTGIWTSMEVAFGGCYNLRVNAYDAPNLSVATSLHRMFADGSFVNGDFSNWDTSNITDMSSMFYYAIRFNKNINSWDTSNVTTMESMFFNANAFNQDLNSWNVSNVTTMKSMFGSADNFNGAIGAWNTSAVTNMEYMFNGANSFNQNINAWDITALTSTRSMFQNANDFNQPLHNWITSNIVTMTSMFQSANSFNQPLDAWDVSSVKYIQGMFQNTQAFNQDLNNWDTSAFTHINSMFRSSVFNGNISSWDTSSVTTIDGVFRDNLVFNQNIGAWDTSSVTQMQSTFFNARAFNQNINNWNVSAVTTMQGMFLHARKFNQDLSAWNFGTGLTTLTEMFRDARAFNQNISSWDVSNVQSFQGMFEGAISFDQDLSNWSVETPTSWPDFYKMFLGAKLSTINYDALLVGWDAQNLNPGIYFSGGNSKYCSANAQTARANMMAATGAGGDNWTITDAGLCAGLSFGRFTTTITVVENTTLVPTFAAVDPEGDVITYTITGGDDQAKFNIVNATGVLNFNTAPAFDTPTDTDANNEYLVTITATANGDTATQAITVIVAEELMLCSIDTIDPVAITQNITVQLNALGIATITPADINNGSTDNCSIASMSLDKTTFNCANIGDNTVMLSVEDLNGNINIAPATVTIEAVVSTFSSGWDITPNLGSKIMFNLDYNTSTFGNITACTCEVSAGRTLVVNPNGFLKIYGNIVNDGIIEVQHQGAVVQVDDLATNTGTGVYKTFIETTQLDDADRFTYFSSPSDNATLQVFSSWANMGNIWDFNTTTQQWHLLNGTETTQKAVGYAVRPATTNTFPFNGNVEFNGAFNNGVVTKQIIYNVGGNDDDNNLVGNPYPSAIDAAMLLNNNPGTNAFYFWTHKSVLGATGYLGDDYAMWNNLGGIASASGSPAPSGYIASGQGFFVTATASGNFTFNNALRVTDNNTNFQRTANNNDDKIWINLTNDENYFSQILIGFINNGSIGFDATYDASRIASGSVISFYTIAQNNNHYGIEARPLLTDDTTIPLGIDLSTNSSANFSFSIDRFENLADVTVYLKDNLLNNIHNLNVSDYNFTISSDGEINTRFELVFSRSALGNLENELLHTELNVFNIDASTIGINTNNNALIKELKIYDMLGKLIVDKQPLKTSFEINVNLNTGTILLVKAQLENGSILHKKMIKF